jgi:hypothetical protein
VANKIEEQTTRWMLNAADIMIKAIILNNSYAARVALTNIRETIDSYIEPLEKEDA